MIYFRIDLGFRHGAQQGTLFSVTWSKSEGFPGVLRNKGTYQFFFKATVTKTFRKQFDLLTQTTREKVKYSI